uniref:Uncharacterized protein n=1 Tax=Parastrongyloides trichosuri TaxID=131310 RepID=A0A0N5A008_PARTI
MSIASPMSVHVELVEAQQPRLGGDQGGDRRNGVVAPAGPERLLAAARRAVAPLFHQVVDARHEGVEVGPHLLLLGRRGIEEVHQHGLAASGRAPDVDAAHGRLGAEQPLLRQVGLQPFKRADQGGLGRLGRDHAFFHADVVGVADAGGHAQQIAPRPGRGKAVAVSGVDLEDSGCFTAAKDPNAEAFLPNAPVQRMISSWAIASPS